MPNLNKKLDNCKHPNSRKVMSIIKQMKKKEKRENVKLGTHIKQNLIGEKILWFKENLPQDSGPVISKEQILDLITVYLSRFDEELEQIALKNSVGQRKNRQHAGREDVIKITQKREQEEFDTCGLEIPDLMDNKQLELLQGWNGELRYLQNFKLRRFSKKFLMD